MFRKYLGVTYSSIRSYRRQARTPQNIGVRKQMRVIDEGIAPNFREKLDDINERMLEDLETDFMNARQIATEHKAEIKSLGQKIEKIKIKRKYFPQMQNPNLLTWAEKEQIRHLHQSDPDVWTVERLSERFPATPPIIAKIIKSQWRPSNKERIIHHDKVVSENWKLLKKKQLVIPDVDLENHVMKFTARDKLKLPEDPNYLQEYAPKPLVDTSGEFASMVTNNQKVIEAGDENDSFVELRRSRRMPKERHNSKLYTLSELRDEFRQRVEKEKHLGITDVDKYFLKGSDVDTKEHNFIEEIQDVPVTSKVPAKVDKLEALASALQQDMYPLKVTIPSDLAKDGAIYKLKDCFYNDKGEFLYRVPGMK